MIRFAIFPTVMLPCVSESPIAYAPLMVAALMASSGVIFILMHARETTKFIFPDGVDPGLKSVAKARGNPALIMSRAGVYGIPKKNEQEGSATGIVQVPNKAAISSDVITSR